MRLKNQFQPVVAGLVVVLMLSAGAAMAAVPSNIEVASTPKITLQVTDTVDQVEGTMISGEISRSRFSSRSPVSGRIVVEVFAADGQSLSRTSSNVSPHFVGRGLRPSTFAVQLDHQVPADGRAVVTFGR